MLSRVKQYFSSLTVVYICCVRRELLEKCKGCLCNFVLLTATLYVMHNFIFYINRNLYFFATSKKLFWKVRTKGDGEAATSVPLPYTIFILTWLFTFSSLCVENMHQKSNRWQSCIKASLHSFLNSTLSWAQWMALDVSMQIQFSWYTKSKA